MPAFPMEAQMPYAYTLVTTIPASPQEIYDAWLDSLAHSEMTQAPASMSDEIGAEISAWDGYITGRNLELTPGERIAQSWRTEEFEDDHEDSIVTLTLEEIGDGTLLTLVHSNVPDGQTSYELGGWEDHYFEPMKGYFADRRPTGAGKGAKKAAAPTKRAAEKEKSKRAAPKAKAKPKAKATPSKARTKRAVTARPKTAPVARTAKGKRRK
jgi:uncharacterized protein YndB with AHSA1/START domain